MSEGSKSALAVLAGISIIVFGFMYVMKPNYDKTKALQVECVQLQQRLTDLQGKEARREEYIAGTEKYEAKFEETLNRFAPDLNQEVTIMFLEGIKDNNEFQIDQMELGEPELFYTLGLNGGDAMLNTTGASTTTTEAATTAATTEAATTAASTEAATTAASAELVEADITSEGGYDCYRADFPMDYFGSYESLKDVVQYVNEFENRMTIDSIDITYEADKERYAGTLNMKVYAITGPDRAERSMEMNEVEIGSDNIFQGSVGNVTSSSETKLTKYDENDGAEIEANYDFYAMLNPSTSDVSAKVVGQNGAGKDASVISNSDNDVTTLTFDFFEQDGKNYCKYTLGNSVSYQAEVTSAEDIKLLIHSSARKNDDDKVGLKITIRNTTSLPVYVKVADDDSVSPRVNIASKSGSVKVY